MPLLFSFFVSLDVRFRTFNDVKICVASYFMYGVSHEGKYCTFNKNISEKKNQTTVRGQDGKISDTRGKDFYWSPTRPSLVGDQTSFPWVSEIFPSCTLTAVWFFFSLFYLFSLNIFVLFTFHRVFSRKIVFRWWSWLSIYRYTSMYWQYFNCIS